MTDEEILNRIDLDRAIESLPQNIRQAVELYRQGYNWAEVADMLGLHRSTLRNRIRESCFSGMPTNVASWNYHRHKAKKPKEKTLPEINRSEGWEDYVLSYSGVIKAIAAKATQDEGLRQDAYQEAMIDLLCVRPEKVRAYAKYAAGEMSEEKWSKELDRYMRNVIRNSILSMLQSWNTGSWDHGRTATVNGKKKHYPRRYSSLDQLMDDSGMDVDEDGNVSWDHVSDDGLAD